MAKFGRYEFGKAEPTEVYGGDYLALETGFVRIFKGDSSFRDAMTKPRLVAAIHLDKGQSVREIKMEVKSPAKQNPFKLETPVGRRFR